MSGMKRAAGGVRMGPVSIFSLVIALCVAVLAVLAVSTAQADRALAVRQGDFLQAEYANETAGQTFLAEVDEAVGAIAADPATGSDQQAVLDALAGELPRICADAQSAAGGSEVTVDARIAGSTVHVTCSSSAGRQLSIQLAVAPDATVEVQAWQSTTPWVEPEQPQLWTGQ